VRNSEFAFISGALGGIVLPFLLIMGIYAWGVELLWQPMAGGGQEINPHCLIWLLFSIPVGAVSGCMISWRQFQRPVVWSELLLGWCGGSSGGFIAMYNLATFLSPPLILPTCIGGLVFAGVMYFAAMRKQKLGSQYIKLPL
jgi:hypothetical protein